jgi:hypothetical protein
LNGFVPPDAGYFFCLPITISDTAASSRVAGRFFFGYFLLAKQKKVTRLQAERSRSISAAQRIVELIARQ